MDRFRITSKYTKATASTLTAPYYTIVIISAASKELRFGPDDPNYFIYSYALENLATEVFGDSSAVLCHIAIRTTFS